MIGQTGTLKNLPPRGVLTSTRTDVMDLASRDHLDDSAFVVPSGNTSSVLFWSTGADTEGGGADGSVFRVAQNMPTLTTPKRVWSDNVA
jgi:hypothetical protein